MKWLEYLLDVHEMLHLLHISSLGLILLIRKEVVYLIIHFDNQL